MLKNFTVSLNEKMKEKPEITSGKIFDKKNKIVIKRLENEAESLVNCAYRAYGNSYIHKYIYDKTMIDKLNHEEKIISYIALNEEKRVVGHVALEYFNKANICEISHAFVDPEFRGRGCLTDLTRFAIDESKKRGDVGIYVHAVTSHIYSQKSAQSNGFKDCALLLSRIPALDFKEIDGKSPKRESLILEYKYLKKQRKKYIYASEKYKKMIEDIYHNLGVKIVFKKLKDNEEKYSKETRIETVVDNYDTATIYVKNFAKDGMNKILKQFNKLYFERKKVIFLKLKLCSKSSIYIWNQMEQIGFYFAGIMPGDNEDDEVILQYINDHIDCENIYANSVVGNALIEQIKKQNIAYNGKRRISI
ncbi:MAG: GNAT family N-acetyltransferase [Clostridium argentinense]|uniref:GNAT family N-acetyltransferase n=1 Tax=Clostridium faecium TaxID=2762223 RepID=A0ABR8YU21_9CLOT|nr:MULTISPECIES: GNAT family N-acetyltransferase [Clostridium]MBD8047762.1 GNAT family N-acetyltransferase [Clostridium faecium]MBS5824158.1 GNAT family N-acetyltransferase [Clostridium argentinense]MDU1350438.1 GNAT family N-acetyltransferase [Clostridium argentinense]